MIKKPILLDFGRYTQRPDNAALRYSIKNIEDQLVIYEYTSSPIPYELINANEYIRAEPLSNLGFIADQLDEDVSVAYIEAVTYRDSEKGGELEIIGNRNEITF